MPDKVSILAVLVLYRRSIEESVTWKALLGQVDGKLKESVDFHLLVCDNGPLSYAHEVPLLPGWADYVGVHDNHGLAWAYNLGLARAQERGAEWIMTLDQDTALPPDFLGRMAKLAKQDDSEAAEAIVPQLVSEHGHVHSPVIAGMMGETMVPLGFRGMADGEVRPFNSAAMVRTSALAAVGGYDRRFWMNYLDHSIFHALQKAGFKIRIAGEVQVQHHLSLHEGREHMSEQHFKHFSAAESAFRDLYACRLEGWLFTARLLLRAINQKRRHDPAHFFRATLVVLKSRLFIGRRERIRRWEADMTLMAADPQIAFQVRGSPAGAAPFESDTVSAEKVLMVVVLYRAATGGGHPEWRTLRCLEAAMTSDPKLLDDYHLLLWDNSPERGEIELQIPFEYHQAEGNDGVSGAYNGALAIGKRSGYEWMLLLDDDTEVTPGYLAGMIECRSECNDNAEIAAIAPLLLDKEFQLSPQQVFTHRTVPVAQSPARILEENCFAANSGVMMRVAALAAIGGYSLDFWLDYSDIYVFHRLKAAGKRLYFAADLRLQHSMTMLDYDGRMTVDRYGNFLCAEQAFFDLYKSASQNAVQVLRLFARIFRQRVYHNKAFSRLTAVFLLRRLSTSKKTRLKQWSERKNLRHAMSARLKEEA